MSIAQRITIQFEASPEFKLHAEQEAARLNLTLGAYFEYLTKRTNAGIDAKRFDRIVDEVFGRYGKTMRNLAR